MTVTAFLGREKGSGPICATTNAARRCAPPGLHANWTCPLFPSGPPTGAHQATKLRLYQPRPGDESVYPFRVGGMWDAAGMLLLGCHGLCPCPPREHWPSQCHPTPVPSASSDHQSEHRGTDCGPPRAGACDSWRGRGKLRACQECPRSRPALSPDYSWREGASAVTFTK